MRQTLAFLFIISALLSACGAPAAPSPSATAAPVASQPATQALPTATASPETLPSATPTEAPTATAALPTRWFWAVPEGKDEILAFNAAGQVNSVLDLTGIQHQGFEPLIRVGDDRAVAFFNNYDSPKAFLLTSDSATPIELPDVQVPLPGNSWSIVAQHGASIVMAPTGTATTPAILIDGENGQASLVAPDVYGPTQTGYLLRFSADGGSLRFATGAPPEPVEVRNLDLQSGEETTFFQPSSHLRMDAFGQIWYDTSNREAQAADGQPVAVSNTDANANNFPFDNGWILAAQYDCAEPCQLQAYPGVGNAAALEYSLPAELAPGSVVISGAQLLDQNRLLVSVLDLNSGDFLPALWLLAPDGTGQLLGRGMESNPSTPPYRLPGSSDDGRTILVYPADDTSTFSIYDLAAGKPLFSETTAKPDAFLEVMYFPEGILVLEVGDPTQGAPSRNWVYSFETASADEVKPPAGEGYCLALTPDGKPVCMTEGGVVVYDPGSGQATPLVEEPVNDLSD